MTRVADRVQSRRLRIAIRIVVGALAATIAVFAVWIVGFESQWAVAAVLAVGPVGAVLATRKFDDDAPWDPPAREAPRGTRLTVTTIEHSLAACDRLSRSAIVRPVQALLISERDDRLARLTVLRRLRALLGPDALTLLQPNDDNSVSSAAIAKCLDDIERLRTHQQTAR